MPVTKSFVYVVIEVSSDLDAQTIADRLEPVLDAEDIEVAIETHLLDDEPAAHHFVVDKVRVVARGADEALDGLVSMTTSLHEARVAALYLEDVAHVAMAELRDNQADERGYSSLDALSEAGLAEQRALLGPRLARYGFPPLVEVLPEPSALASIWGMRERIYAAEGIAWDPIDDGGVVNAHRDWTTEAACVFHDPSKTAVACPVTAIAWPHLRVQLAGRDIPMCDKHSGIALGFDEATLREHIQPGALVEGDDPEPEPYEGSFGEAADKEGARTAADAQGAEESEP